MNPDTNKFENLDIKKELRTMVKQDGLRLKTMQDIIDEVNAGNVLVRADGTEVPKHWSIFQVDENYVINDYTFKCKYIGETSILFEPVGPIEIGKSDEQKDK